MNIIKEGDGNYNEAIKEIGELLADVFHYYFFTGRDFEQYFIIVWRYLLTEMKSDPAMKGAWSFYLFRAFYVFVYDMLYVKKELNYDALDFSRYIPWFARCREVLTGTVALQKASNKTRRE